MGNERPKSRRGKEPEITRRGFLHGVKTAAEVAAASSLTVGVTGGLAYLALDKKKEGQRPPDIQCNFADLGLEGKACTGLAKGYFGFYGDRPYPRRDQINFQKSLARLWEHKVGIVKKTGTAEQYELMEALANEEVGTYQKLWSEGKEKESISDFVDLVGFFARTEQDLIKSLDWDKVTAHYGVRDEWHLKMLRHLGARLHGRSLAAYSMTEIMPYSEKDDQLGILTYDALLKTGGAAYVERIPALGDSLVSFGPFQFTKYAVDNNIAKSLVKDLPDNKQIPRHVADFTTMRDHAGAAFLFGFDNVAHAASAISAQDRDDRKINKISNIDGATFASVIAAHHYRPAVAHRSLMEWTESEDDSRAYHEFCTKHDPLVGGYARRSEHNFESVEAFFKSQPVLTSLF